MDNLWLLTEERPKTSVIEQIISTYCQDFNDQIIKSAAIKIRPIIVNDVFKFLYVVEGLKTANTGNIYIKTVSGSSSFLDFLLYKQRTEPSENNASEEPLMAIEETKTSDDESRNTGVYQRGTKFVYAPHFFKRSKLYMLYNEELGARKGKRPSDTSIFGTKILKTLGVTIVGKEPDPLFNPFKSLSELIEFKNGMRKPPAGNVPISITIFNDHIEISGRLAKPANAQNIGHDPNIGALSMIAKCIRVLGWKKDIIITKHGVGQNYVSRAGGSNKFLYICHILGLKLEGIKMPTIKLPNSYWHYEKSSEKMTSILLHLTCAYYGIIGIYENHAGCERGYFRTRKGELVALPKKDTSGKNLLLPDVVLLNKAENYILMVEGKKLTTVNNGIEEIKLYNSIENEYIKKEYPAAKILRCVSTFGGNLANSGRRGGIQLHKDVLIHMNVTGEIFINSRAPEFVKRVFKSININA